MGVWLVVVGLAMFMGTYALLGGDVARALRAGGRSAGKLREALAVKLGEFDARGSARQRKAQVTRDMPTFLDIVTLGLSAGLSFDASVELYCRRFDSVLASSLGDSLQLWRLGVSSRAEALEHTAEELGVPALTRFAQTVSESLAFGTPLSQTLERQAQIIRDEQRALVEEEIEKTPVKLLIPLATLIVPSMLLAVLGPLLGPALGTL